MEVTKPLLLFLIYICTVNSNNIFYQFIGKIHWFKNKLGRFLCKRPYDPSKKLIKSDDVDQLLVNTSYVVNAQMFSALVADNTLKKKFFCLFLFFFFVISSNNFLANLYQIQIVGLLVMPFSKPPSTISTI